MNDWLRILFGLEEGEVPSGGESHWELSGLPQGGWLLAAFAILAAALILIVLLYVREKRLSVGQRILLTALRLGALAIIVLILLNPRLLTEIRLEHPGKTLLLFDVSASMGQTDEFDDSGSVTSAPAGQSRGELARNALVQARVVERLGERNRVQAYTFGSELEPVGDLDDAELLHSRAPETSLGSAIEEAVESVRSDPLAGIVVVSDGRSNADQSPLEVVRAWTLDRRAPVYSVGVGQSREPRNWAVEEIIVPPVVELGYPVQIEAQLALAGIESTAKVALWRSLEDGTQRVRLEQREIETDVGRTEARVKFIDRAEEKGRFRYTVRVDRKPGEIEYRDNERSALVTVAEENRRILLLAGLAANEYKFLRNLLLRDEGVQVSCWLSSADSRLQQDGDVVIDELPRSFEQLREYDAVLMIDPDPRDLSPELQKSLSRFVAESGGGLAYVAGDVFTPTIAREPAYSSLRKLLPIDLTAAVVPGPGHIFDDAWQAALTPRGREHALCRLSDEAEENDTVWGLLQELYFCYPTSRLRPAAIALLRSPEHVLAAIHRAGLGEVFYIGSDEFWRWRSGGTSVHERFWSGVVRYLTIGKYQTGSGEVKVETDRDRYRLGDDIRLTAQLVDARRQPIEKPRIEVIVERATEDAPEGPAAVVAAPSAAQAATAARTLVSLLPVPGEPGRYAGVYRPQTAGGYEARIGDEGETWFRVDAPSSELDDLTPDIEMLSTLSRETGGRLFRLDELDDLVTAIPKTSVIEVLGRRATSVWDSAFLMLLFCGLLVSEWVLRKLWRLN